jgi:O-antigen/teichoic acid export membrane protein
MSGSRNTLSAVSITVVARLVVLVSGFLASVLTARGLGVEGRGQYYAVMTLAAIIAQLGNLGLTSSNTFLAARDRTHSWALVVNGIWLCVSLGIVTALVVVFLDDVMASRLGIPTALAWTLCISAPAILGFTLTSSVMVANERFFAMNLWSVVNAIVVLAAIGLCAVSGANSATVVIVITLVALFVAVGVTFDAGRGLDRTSGWAVDQVRLRASVQFALRAYLALLAGFLIQRIGVTLLLAYRGPADIGVFSIAAQISDVLVILPTSVAMVLFPSLVREPELAWGKTKQAMVIVVAVMSLGSVGVWLLGEPILKLLFGIEFAPAYPVLMWLLPAVLALSVTSILSQYVVSEGFPRSLVVLWIIGLAVCIAAGTVLVESRGAIGAAQAQSIGAVLVCIGVLALTARRRSLDQKTQSRV